VKGVRRGSMHGEGATGLLGLGPILRAGWVPMGAFAKVETITRRDDHVARELDPAPCLPQYSARGGQRKR
jgi:hypothetical protein